MIEFIFGVALNGTSQSPSKYKVVHETAKTYIIDRFVGNRVRKSTMSDRWEMYFTKEAEAKSFLESLNNHIEKSCKNIDVQYLYKMLTTIKNEEFVTDKLDMVIDYVKEFLK